MIDPDEDGDRARPFVAPQDSGEELSYRIELWDREGAKVERVLARAGALLVARAIFRAARSEHFGRRLTLCQGARILDQTD